MYRPYAIRPANENRRAALAVAKCYGGSSSSTPEIPPEFRPFITSALARMTQQQGLNPIDSYNAPNPMEVEGLSPTQQLGMSYAAGNMQNSPFSQLAAQAAQRAAGMAGAGYTTGQYDPNGEMDLQSWSDVMRRSMGVGDEMGGQMNQTQGPLGGTVGDASQSGQGSNTGGPPNTGLNPLGGLQDDSGGVSASQGGPQSFQAALGGPLGLHESWAQRLGMSGADVVNHWDAQHPNAAPELFQGAAGNGSHTFMTRDSQGNNVPLMEQNGLNGEAGHTWDRPSDPRAAAAWDRLNNRPHVGFGGSTNHPTGTTPSAAPAKKAGA